MNIIKKYFQRLKISLINDSLLYSILLAGLLIFLSIEIFSPLIIDNPLIELAITLFFLRYIIQIFFLLNKTYFFYVISTLLLVIIVAEVGIGKFILSRQLTVKEVNGANYYTEDSLMGARFTPGIVNVESIKSLSNGEIIYDCFYSSDNLGRRIGKYKCDTGNKHAIFLGCSFTFGEGLNFDSTFPYLFKLESPEYAIYNYGFKAYGPNQFPFLFPEYLNTINNISVKNDSGFCLYTFIDDHYNRVYGSSSYLNYASKTPDVYIKDGKLFFTKRPWLQLHIAELINKSNICQYLNIQIPHPNSGAFYERFADIVNYTAQQYYKLKPKGKFIVGLYPVWKTDTTFLKYLSPKILVFNPTIPPDLWEQRDKYFMNQKYDGHPSKDFNLYYVNKFVKYLKSVKY